MHFGLVIIRLYFVTCAGNASEGVGIHRQNTYKRDQFHKSIIHENNALSTDNHFVDWNYTHGTEFVE